MNQFVSPPWLGSWQHIGVNKFIPTSVISITVAIVPQSFCRGMMLFIAVVDAGSFTLAADRLNIPKSKLLRTYRGDAIGGMLTGLRCRFTPDI